MNARARVARQIVKARTSETRVTARAIRAVATGTPQAAKTHMVAAGIDTATAKRFAGAFSNRQTPTAVAKTTVKLRGRRTKRVAVKLYDTPTFAARLAAYRPKDKAAAALFNRAAHRLAA